MASKSHYLVITYPSWAHIRTQIALSNALLQVNPNLQVTMLLPAKRSKAAALEIAQYVAIPQDRLRILHYGDDEQKEVGGMWNPRGGFRDECMAQLEPFIDSLAKREAITDPVTSESITPHERPYDIILSDITLAMSGSAIKTKLEELTGKSPKLIVSCPYNSAFLLFFLTMDGEFLSRVNRMVDESAGDEEKLETLKQELIINNADMAPAIPDLWPFYFYESCPVKEESVLRYAPRVAGMIKVFNSSVDGYIVAWPHALGINQQAPLIKNFGQVFQVGPQLPPVVQDEWSVETKKGECREYLDASPEQSVIYISFGSVVYAPSYDQIRILLDVLEEVGARYIMAEGNAPAETRELLRSRVGKGKDHGLLVVWAPQRAILSHNATRVFLSHGGSNSAMESMLFKVPMAQWPSGFDQPYIANELDKLGVARELLQIRDGFNVGKPVARDGRVVEGTEEALRKELLEVFGPESDALIASLRSKVEQVGDLLQVDRETGGSAGAVKELAFLGSAASV